MRRIAGALRNAAVVAVILAMIPATAAWAASPPEPTYGGAAVDGNSGEWDLTGDFFADLYRAGRPTKDVLARLYVRYDCATSTLFALVLAEPGHVIDADAGAGEHFIKIGHPALVDEGSGDDGLVPDFAWIGLSANGGTAEGWEASARLAPSAYTTLSVHSQIDNQQTSAVADRAIDLTLLCYDLGDLPATYPITTLADDGARHSIGNLFLGPTVDRESDGQPNASALGDDISGDDDDGVSPTTGFVWTVGNPEDGHGGRLDIFVTGGPGCLSGWIDWSRNGDFLDAGENIVDNVLLPAGQSQVSFPIPAGTLLDSHVFARFRLYELASGSCASVTPSLTGAATNGEVEDHVFEFPTPTAVVITNLRARARANRISLALAAGGALLLIGLAVAWRRR